MFFKQRSNTALRGGYMKEPDYIGCNFVDMPFKKYNSDKELFKFQLNRQYKTEL